MPLYLWLKKDSERRLQHRLKNARIAFAEIKNLHGYHKCVPEDEQQSWHNSGRNQLPVGYTFWVSVGVCVCACASVCCLPMRSLVL